MSSTRRCNFSRAVPALLVVVLLASGCATTRRAPGFAEELALGPGPGILLTNVPSLRADAAKGGISAVASLFAYWKKPVLSSEAESRLVAAMSSMLIPPEEVMIDLADRRLLWSYAFYATMREVEERLLSGIPLLVMVQDRADDPKTRRYMILMGFNQPAEKLLVHEGGREPRVYTYAAFRPIWKPVRNWTLVLCPPDRISWPLSVREWVARSRFYERIGMWADALADLDTLQQNDPRNINILLAQARIHQRARNPVAAEQAYRDALVLDPLSARAANNLAYLLGQQPEQRREAERWARRALTMEPSNPAYLDTLGMILLALEQPAEAAVVLERARHRAANLPLSARREIEIRLLRAFILSGQVHLAHQVWQDMVRLGGEVELPPDLRDALTKPPANHVDREPPNR